MWTDTQPEESAAAYEKPTVISFTEEELLESMDIRGFSDPVVGPKIF
jgi:hypothetical protein